MDTSNGSSILLPTEKTPPALTAQAAKVLLYGHPKVGKSTLAAGVEPDRTLFLQCDPGLGGLEVFQVPIRSWDEFRRVGAELKAEMNGDSPRFSTIVIDTIDELSKMCADSQLRKLGITHASDLGYGKGWGVINDEFRARIVKLANLGAGVWFISHARERENKSRVGDITRIEPTLGGQQRQFIEGFCDFIFYAELRLGEDGEQRLLRTAPGENFEAGSRVALPDPLPLNAVAVREAMANACTQLTQTGEQN